MSYPGFRIGLHSLQVFQSGEEAQQISQARAAGISDALVAGQPDGRKETEETGGDEIVQ